MDLLNENLANIKNNQNIDLVEKEKQFRTVIRKWNLKELKNKLTLDLSQYSNPNTSLFKIINLFDNSTYYGLSSDKYLSNRLCILNESYNLYKNKNKKGYCSVFEMFEKFGYKSCYIMFLEHIPNNDINIPIQKLKNIIKSDPNSINKRIMGRGRCEYFKDCNYFSQRKYNSNNKEAINNRKKLKIKIEKLDIDNNKPDLDDNIKKEFEIKKQLLIDELNKLYKKNKIKH